MRTTTHPNYLQSIGILALVVLISAATSCRTHRKTIREPLRLHGTEFLIEQMKEHEFQTDYFTARFSAVVERNSERMSFNGQVRMKRDSIIWLTISPALGIEMGRLIITGDSVKWMNRMESNYLLAETEKLTSLIHPLVEYDLLQSFILGNDLTLYDNTQFRGSIDSREYKLSVTQRRSLKRQMREDETIEAIPMQHLWLDPETFRITRVAIRDLQDKNARIDAEYEKFTAVNGSLFAARQRYNIQGGDNQLSISINFNRMDTPASVTFPFTISDRFIRLDI